MIVARSTVHAVSTLSFPPAWHSDNGEGHSKKKKPNTQVNPIATNAATLHR